MRLAERKKWLKKNSAARNQIAKEQKKFESLHANTVQQSNVNNSPPTNGSQEPNYEAAEALYPQQSLGTSYGAPQRLKGSLRKSQYI